MVWRYLSPDGRAIPVTRQADYFAALRGHRMNSNISSGMVSEKAVNPQRESEIEYQRQYLEKQLPEYATQHRLDGLHA